MLLFHRHSGAVLKTTHQIYGTGIFETISQCEISCTGCAITEKPLPMICTGCTVSEKPLYMTRTGCPLIVQDLPVCVKNYLAIDKRRNQSGTPVQNIFTRGSNCVQGFTI